MDYARSFAHSNTVTDFLQKPNVVLRLISTFIMMLVFACIQDKGYDKTGRCLYNGKHGACSFTIGIGLIGFFVGIFFLAVTYFWDRITNSVTRKYIVFADLCVSCFLAFLFFVDFCFITDMWRKTDKSTIVSSFAKSNLQFTIVCTLLCIFLLAYQAFMAYKQMEQIQDDASGFDNTGGFAGQGGIGAQGGYGGQPFPPHTEAADNYQSPYAS